MPPKKRKGGISDASEESPAKKAQSAAKSTRPARASTRSHAAAPKYAEDDTHSDSDSTLEPPFTGKSKAANRAPASKRGIKKSSSTLDVAPNSSTKPSTTSEAIARKSPESSTTRSYWLMKAEPNTRLENGHDVAFSIDDLAARTSPEPWDGIRNHVAKNNLLAMKKGDLAFFYHSNCKVPGIVGIMEIVHEASPDESAWDSKSAYYDPKSGPDKRTWYLVDVEFRRKFEGIVSLKELQEHKGSGGKLEGMQLHRLARLSVSKVEEKEWQFIMKLAEAKKAE